MKLLILLFTLSFAFSTSAQSVKLRKASPSDVDSSFDFKPYNYPKPIKRTIQSTSSQKIDEKKVKKINDSMSDKLRKNVATYLALQNTKYHLDRYIQTKNQESLNVLLSGWSMEDKTLVKKDLAKLDKSFRVKVEGESLILKSRKQKIALEVEDALEGRYRINGKRLFLTHFRRYEIMKKEINQALGLKNQAQFHLFNLFLTPAHAIGFLAPLAPVVAPAATAAATVQAIAVAKFVGTHIILPVVVGGLSAYAINKFAAHDFARNLAYYNPERVVRLMCEGKMSPTAHFDREVDCANVKKSDMEVEIKRADKEELYAVPNPKMEKKCIKTADGFARDAGITFHKKSENGEIKVQQVEATHRLRFEFVSNPKDPKKLITKTMIETVYDKNGNREGQRIWTFDGDDFIVREYNNEQINQLDSNLYKHSVVPKVYDCTGKKLTEEEVCKKLDKGLLAAAKPQVSCTMDNPEQVIEQIKAEKQDERFQQKSVGGRAIR